LHIARFLSAGLARQDRGERRLAPAEAVECRDDIVEGFEAEHAFGAGAEFAGSLWAAEEKHAQDSDLAAVEIENFLQTMFVLSDAAVGAAGRTGETFFLQRGKCVTHGVFLEGHYRVAIVFLVARVYQSVERERIVVGRGDVFFDERAENANFDVCEGIHQVDCTAAAS